MWCVAERPAFVRKEAPCGCQRKADDARKLFGNGVEINQAPDHCGIDGKARERNKKEAHGFAWAVGLIIRHQSCCVSLKRRDFTGRSSSCQL